MPWKEKDYNIPAEQWCRWCKYANRQESAWYIICLKDNTKHLWFYDGCDKCEQNENFGV